MSLRLNRRLAIALVLVGWVLLGRSVIKHRLILARIGMVVLRVGEGVDTLLGMSLVDVVVWSLMVRRFRRSKARVVGIGVVRKVVSISVVSWVKTYSVVNSIVVRKKGIVSSRFVGRC